MDTKNFNYLLKINAIYNNNNSEDDFNIFSDILIFFNKYNNELLINYNFIYPDSDILKNIKKGEFILNIGEMETDFIINNIKNNINFIKKLLFYKIFDQIFDGDHLNFEIIY